LNAAELMGESLGMGGTDGEIVYPNEDDDYE
jgi:hypothetical protein